MTKKTTQTVPAEACQLNNVEVDVSNANGDEAKTAPVSFLARSGDPIEHPYWGTVIHDMSGMVLPSRGRVPIDVNHDGDPIGYANHFDVSSGDLVANGTLINEGGDSKVSSLITRARHGVPFESSISFGGTGIRLQRIKPNTPVEVNGRTFEFETPATIVRKWPLRAISIVSQGADQFTSASFSSSEEVAVTVIDEDEDMSATETVEAKVANAEAVEAQTDTDTAEAIVTDEVQTDAVEAEAVELAAAPKTGTDFMQFFGELDGALYFAKGLSFEEAMFSHFKKLQDTVHDLEAKLDLSSKVGESEDAVSFSERSDKPKKEMAVRIRGMS